MASAVNTPSIDNMAAQPGKRVIRRAPKVAVDTREQDKIIRDAPPNPVVNEKMPAVAVVSAPHDDPRTTPTIIHNHVYFVFEAKRQPQSPIDDSERASRQFNAL